MLHEHEDGSYSHLLRIPAGAGSKEPVSHEFYEEVYYLEGEMLNTRTSERMVGGTYVFHNPGEKHGPFKCVRPCLILEFRYYK